MGNLLSVLSSPAAIGVLIVAVALIGYTVYSYAYAPYKVLKKCGIRGPKPRPIVGNLALQKQGWLKSQQALMKNYGPVAGHYIGCTPVVMIADPKLLETVLIKKVEDFQDAMKILPYQYPNEGVPHGLPTSWGSYWRKMRTALEPLFSAVNKKEMSAVVQGKCDTLMKKLGEIADTGKSGDIHRTIYNYSLETDLVVIFGRDTDIQNGVKHEFAEMIEKAFRSKEEDIPNMMKACLIQSNFPFLKRLVQRQYSNSDKGKYFAETVKMTKQWLAARKQARTALKYKDLMQLMMDTQEGPDGFTDEEIVSQSVTFIIGVHEDLANVVSYALYLMALNPSVQDNLRTEIKNFFRDYPEASTYDASQQLQYLDMVMDETDRVFTPVPRLTRECTKTTQFDGFTVPAGAIVELPIYMLHRNPKYWPNPEKFDPERHTLEKKAQRPPLCLMPFGGGQRICIGRKLAAIIYKMAVIEAVRKYEFIQAPDTEIPLAQVVGVIALSPKNGIHLRINRLH